MKKHLLAAAIATAVAVPAMAQVTVYGVIDQTVFNSTNAGANARAVRGVGNGGMATPRLGFTGSEDLGNGLKASFTLESEIYPDTGTAASDLFTRGAFLALSGAFGTVSIGHQNTETYGLAGKTDPAQGGNIGSVLLEDDSSSRVNATGVSGDGDAYTASRMNNSIKYLTNRMSGAQFGAMYGFGTGAETAGAAGAGAIWEISANYESGPVFANVAYQSLNSTASVNTNSSWVLAGSYDFGAAKLMAGNYRHTNETTDKDADRAFVAVEVPVSGATKARAGYVSLKDGSRTGSDKMYMARIENALSKRTTVYAVYANMDNGANSKVSVASDSKFDEALIGVAGKDQTAIGLGIIHKF